jgi:hypothetical protein
MVKSTFLDKLKKWRKDKEEQYARAIMEKPERSTILKIFRPPEVALIMGSRRYGKTGVAHKIAEDIHRSKGLPAMVHLPPSAPASTRQKIQKLLPRWMLVTTKKEEWVKNSVVIYDEAAQTAHARRTQSGDAVELDNLIGVSGQRNQFLIFICHHSRKLDLNVVREVNHIVWKRPTYAYQLFERDELSDFTMKAYDYFTELRQGKPLTETVKRMLKRHNLVLDFDNFRFYDFTNPLPKHWSEELSNLFEDISKVGRKAPGY